MINQLEGERQLKDEKINRSVIFNGKLIEDLTKCSNKMFKDSGRGCHCSKYKKACSLGKVYLLPTKHKKSYNVPG